MKPGDRQAGRAIRTIHGFSKPVLFFAVVLVLWQYGTPFIGVPQYVLPLPTAVAEKFWQTRAIQLQFLGDTAITTMLGLALALVVGVLLALAVVYIRAIKGTVLSVLAAFNSIPKVAIAPLFVIWFGLGTEPKIALAFLLALFPLFVNSVTGLGEIEPDVLDLARIAGGNPWRIFIKVRLINALPYIFDALKVAFPLALAGSLVGEFISGNRGIGRLVLTGQFNLDSPLVFSALLSVTLFTMLGIGLLTAVESVFLTWRPSARTR